MQCGVSVHLFLFFLKREKVFNLRAKQDLFLARDRGVRGEYPEPKVRNKKARFPTPELTELAIVNSRD